MPRRERGARAGRNLPVAIITALLLAGVLITTLVLSRPVFVAFLLGIVTLALLELLAVLRARATRPARPVVLAMGALLVVGAYLEGPAALSFGLLVTILASFGWYLVDRGRTEVTRNVAATVFAVVYVPFMAAHLSLVVGRADHYVGAVIGYAALVVIYDTAAYATGATLGRRPIAPQVSPNKSWEGAIGASVACLAAGAFLLPLWEPWTLAPAWSWPGPPAWWRRSATCRSRCSSATSPSRTWVRSCPATAACSTGSTPCCSWRRCCTTCWPPSTWSTRRDPLAVRP